MLYRVILRFVGRADLAEDALQETWIRAVSALGGFRWESSLRTWLTAIAIRCCREALRGRPSPVASPGEAAGPEVADWWTARIDLDRAVRGLPPGRREVLLLHDVEGFTHGEIAGLLGIEEGSSKSQLSRARRELRRRLGGEGRREDKEVPRDATR